MNTDHQRSYELVPIVIGGGLDEFAGEDTWRPSTFEIEDVSDRPPAALQAFEPEAPVVPVVPVVPVAPVATVSPKPSALVRRAGQRCRLAISSAVFMIAVAASVVAAWTAAWVSAAIVLIYKRIESGRARRRTAWKPLGLQWVGASALRERRSTVVAFSMALLVVVMAPPGNPPAVSPVAAVSTSTSPEASIPPVDVADASKSDPLPSAPLAERPTAIAPLKPPVVRAALRTVLSAGPEAQKPVLLAANDGDVRETIAAAEPIPVPVAIVSAVLEAPKPAAEEPAAYVPSAVGPAPDALTADRVAINDVLVAYRRSYNALDAGAVSAIWRGADTRALTRAFSTLTRQHLTFDRCDVRVTAADRARARCDGILSYVQKAGDTTPQQRRVSWSMDLDRRDDRWEIVGVQAR